MKRKEEKLGEEECLEEVMKEEGLVCNDIHVWRMATGQ